MVILRRLQLESFREERHQQVSFSQNACPGHLVIFVNSKTPAGNLDSYYPLEPPIVWCRRVQHHRPVIMNYYTTVKSEIVTGKEAPCS